jgi:hypothetical protein
MDNGADAADLRRLEKTRPQERHEHAGQVQIEENPRVHEEGAFKATRRSSFPPGLLRRRVSIASIAAESSSLPPTPYHSALAAQELETRRCHPTPGRLPAAALTGCGPRPTFTEVGKSPIA